MNYLHELGGTGLVVSLTRVEALIAESSAESRTGRLCIQCIMMVSLQKLHHVQVHVHIGSVDLYRK